MSTYKEIILNELPVLTLSCNLLKNITLDDIIIHTNLYELNKYPGLEAEINEEDCICDEFEISICTRDKEFDESSDPTVILITLKTANFDNMYNVYIFCCMLHMEYIEFKVEPNKELYLNPLQSYIHDVFSYMIVRCNFDYGKYLNILRTFYKNRDYMLNIATRKDIKTRYTTSIDNFSVDCSKDVLQKLTFEDMVLFLYHHIIYDMKSTEKLFYSRYIATKKYKDPNLNPNIMLLYAIIHDIQFGYKIPKARTSYKTLSEKRSSKLIKYTFSQSYICDIVNKLRNDSVHPWLVCKIYCILYQYTDRSYIPIKEFYEQYATSVNIKNARKC